MAASRGWSPVTTLDKYKSRNDSQIQKEKVMQKINFVHQWFDIDKLWLIRLEKAAVITDRWLIDSSANAVTALRLFPVIQMQCSDDRTVWSEDICVKNMTIYRPDESRTCWHELAQPTVWSAHPGHREEAEEDRDGEGGRQEGQLQETPARCQHCH